MRTPIRRGQTGRARRSFNACSAWPRIVLLALLLQASNALAADWMPAGESQRQDISEDLAYIKTTAVRPSDGKQVTAHLAFFTSQAFRLEVIDLGAGPEAADATLESAFRSEGCVAGVNGGFFHRIGSRPGWRCQKGDGAIASRRRNS